MGEVGKKPHGMIEHGFPRESVKQRERGSPGVVLCITSSKSQAVVYSARSTTQRGVRRNGECCHGVAPPQFVISWQAYHRMKKKASQAQFYSIHLVCCRISLAISVTVLPSVETSRSSTWLRSMMAASSGARWRCHARPAPSSRCFRRS